MTRLMNRRTVLSLAVSASLLAVQGCGESGGSGAAGGSDSDTIVVGAYLSLTGPQATFGQTTKAGIDLAVKQKNAAGGVNGKKVRVITYDNQGKTQETGTVVTRLVTADKVIAVIGEVASTQSLAAAPICQQYGVPMISPSSTNPKVTQIGDMIFRVCMIDPDQGYAMAKFAIDDLKAKTAAVVVDQKQAYSTGLGEDVTRWFEKLGGKVVSQQSYAGGSADYSAQLNTVKAANPDVVFLTGYYNEAGTMIRQARRAGLTAPFIGGDGWESPKLAELGGEEINGNFYTNHYAPEDPRPESQKFVADYKKEYNEEPGALAALGYDSAMVLFNAIERAGTTHGKALAKAIAATNKFQGVTGAITIDKDRNATKPIVVIEMKKGQPVYRALIQPPQ